MMTTAELEKFKLPELKKRCKELKITGYSKLSKADLISRILAASGTPIAQADQRSPSVSSTRVLPTSDAQVTSTHPSRAQDTADSLQTKKRKVVAEPREATSTAVLSTTSLSDSAKKRPPALTDPRAGRSANVAPCTPASGLQLKRSPLPESTAGSTIALTPAEHTAIVKRQVQKQTKAARIVSNAPEKATGVLRARFVPPPQVTAKPSPQPASVAALTRPDAIKLNTPAERTAYMRSHFLNEMFKHLNASRSAPRPSVDPSDLSSLAFDGFDLKLYSVNCPEGFMVAIRFWITRLHTNMQLGCGQHQTAEGDDPGILGSDLTTWPKVTNVDQISADLWRVVTTTQSLTHPKHDSNASSIPLLGSLVIGQTGELIASSPQLAVLPLAPERLEKANVRQDWQAFIKEQSKPSGVPRLIDRLRTKNSSDSPGGISKRWAQSISDLADGSDLLAVARRAVYTACASNSFSGSQMAAWQIEAELAGRGAPSSEAAPNKLPELYLPESEQVDSVHFPPAPTHDAVAYVHRSSGHTDIVLRETGQVIGEEDGGVVPLWQGLLGCDERGRRDPKICVDFFAGWEERLQVNND